MKTELRLRPGSNQVVVELWHDGDLIGTITGAYGPGVRIISGLRVTSTPLPADGTGIRVLEVGIESEQETMDESVLETKPKGKREKSGASKNDFEARSNDQ